MKLRPIFFLLVFSTQLSFSQFEYGLKVGLNFDSSGDIVVVADQLQKKAFNGKTGYHLGVYQRLIFDFYLRPVSIPKSVANLKINPSILPEGCFFWLKTGACDIFLRPMIWPAKGND